MNDADEPEEIRFRNPVKATGFAQIPHVVTMFLDLSDGAYRLYAWLLRYAQQKDVCWPSGELLCAEMQISRDTLYERFKNLEDLGLIHRERRYGRSSITWIESVEDHPFLKAMAVRLLTTEEGRKNPTSNVGNSRQSSSEKSDIEEEPVKKNQEEEPVTAAGAAAPLGPSPQEQALAEFERRDALARKVSAATRDQEHGAEDEEEGRIPKWSQPDSEDERALLAACHAKRYQQGQKKRAKVLTKALLAGDILRPEDLYQAAIAQGPLRVLPRAYFLERLAQAREHHWSVFGLLKALEELDALARFCNPHLRKERESHGRSDRDSSRQPEKPQPELNLPLSWQ